MIDRLLEYKLIFIFNILENIGEISGIDVYPEFTPNTETREAIQEVAEMIESESEEHFTGSTADFFTMLEND